MTIAIPSAPISPLRQRLIEDMNMCRFSRETVGGTQRRSAGTADGEDHIQLCALPDGHRARMAQSAAGI